MLSSTTLSLTSLLPLLTLVSASPPVFTVDCTKAYGSCDNDCFGIFTQGLPATLHYDAPSSDTESDRRDASGCHEPHGGNSPCGIHGIEPYNTTGTGDSCDEYPYASSTEGGSDAVLRCITPSDNSSEGGQLGSFQNKMCTDASPENPCEYSVAFENYGNSALCADIPQGLPDDGHEFELTGDSYNGFRRRADDPATLYRMSTPNITALVKPEFRREVLLEDGARILLGESNSNISFVGRKTWSFTHGERMIVRELFGEEKSASLRPKVVV